MSTFEENYNAKKRKMRNLLSFSGAFLGIDEDFSIDEDDYHAISHIFLRSKGMKIAGSEITTECGGYVKIQDDDEERRVFQLCIPHMPNAISLPASVGQLSSLVHLRLRRSTLKHLPSSIGQLHSLKSLCLCDAKNLQDLPLEIGELASLKWLDLNGSSIESLPPSIGNLQSLEDLYLYKTRNLLCLPEEIGKLRCLKFLDLQNSAIRSLPKSFGGLVGLTHMSLPHIQIQDSETAAPFLLTLLQQHPLLGDFLNDIFLKSIWRSNPAKFEHLAGCNRARFRSGLGTANQMSMESMPRLWPLALQAAVCAFHLYPSRKWFPTCGIIPEKPDAILWFLQEGRESFLMLLMHRRTANNKLVDAMEID